jgi:hypothetical protein
LLKTGVAVEKGTKTVISVNFTAYGKRRFNNLRANFDREIPRKEFFNSPLPYLTFSPSAWRRHLSC